MRSLLILASAAVWAGCVAVPGTVDIDHLARPQTVTGEMFPALDDGAHEQQSLHFLVRAYGSGKAMRIADISEAAYQRIMVDTGLSSSFQTAGRYKLVVYANADEYRKKTGQPPWSQSVAAGNAIYSYEGGLLDAEISQKLTRLILREYLGQADQINPDYRWVEAGLANFEASKAGHPASGGAARAWQPWPAGWQPMPLDSFIHLAPATERDRDADLWHRQSQSMVRFMLERGGRIGFSQFLSALRQNAFFDKAIADGFPGSWSSLADFYAAWVQAQM
mgnify:CR=1 FL=1